MQLIGMLDSPYVRRVAISLECLEIQFEHKAVSVFSTFEQFQRINPVVKAPTLICDDNEILMDSSLILQYAESRKKGEGLWSADPAQFQHELKGVGLGLATCEKSVQIIYERNLRPKDKQHEPWMERVTGQLKAAYASLESQAQSQGHIFEGGLNQASITTAVAWQFTQSMLSHIILALDHPALSKLSARLEQMPQFMKYPPTGPGVKAKWEEIRKSF